MEKIASNPVTSVAVMVFSALTDPENTLFRGFSVLRGGLRPWSRKGPDHGVGVDPETVTFGPHASQEAPVSLNNEVGGLKGLFSLVIPSKSRK